VTDNSGLTNSTPLTISVQQDPQAITFVADITMQVLYGIGGFYTQAIVTIHRPDGRAVDGVAIAGRWAGILKATGTAVTGPDGRAVLTSKPVKKGGTITFVVTAVVRSGYIYDGSRNVENWDSIEIPRNALPR
jgi:hypothetical protein